MSCLICTQETEAGYVLCRACIQAHRRDLRTVFNARKRINLTNRADPRLRTIDQIKVDYRRYLTADPGPGWIGFINVAAKELDQNARDPEFVPIVDLTRRTAHRVEPAKL